MLLRLALRLDPGDLAARRQLAWALAQLNLHQEAIAENRRLLESMPNDPTISLRLAISLGVVGKHEEAIAGLRAAAARDPQNPLVYQQLGASLSAIGKHQDALAAYRRVATLRPDDIDAVGTIGAVLWQLGQGHAAVDCLQRAMAAKPSLLHATNLGIALAGLRRFAEAEAAYRQALAFEPRSSELKIGLAEVFAQQSRLDESHRLLDEVLALEPTSVPALALLSAVLVANDQADAALAAARRAVDADAQDPLAYVAVGWVQLKRGNPQASFTSANQALHLNRRSVDALAIRGAALSALGNHRSALDAFADVARMEPAFFDHNGQFAPYVSASRAADGVGLTKIH